MISINDVDCEYLFRDDIDEVEFTEDVKKRWNGMSEYERNKYSTTIAEKVVLSASEILDGIYEDLENWSDVEDMYLRLSNDTTDDFVNRFQEILNEISEFPSATVYRKSYEIDPTIDLEEVEE